MSSVDNIIGREKEITLLNSYASSNQAEFIAVYGRRRVGKTFLINNVFSDQLVFSMTGIIGGDKREQINSFIDAMDIYGSPLSQAPSDWYAAFRELRHLLLKKMVDGKRSVIFIDELPCFDTHLSDFINALGHFWNSWASLQPNLMLVVCGSATSWMMKNIINSHGGLHDRITHEIHLKEFTLRETESYLKANGFDWDRLMVAQVYMIMGGIPYYLSLLNKQESLAQNIDRLFFSNSGEMRREFGRLYKTLFAIPDPYISIVEFLFKTRQGKSRDDIAKAIGKNANGRLSQMLQNLIDCDIIRFYRMKNKKISTRGGLYQLTDLYSIFYLTFVKDGTSEEQFWSKSQNTPQLSSWLGLSFERLCHKHIAEIKRALHIDTIKTEYYSWRYQGDDGKQKSQIDLVIERADKMTNICEIKYSAAPYRLDKDEFDKCQRRYEDFKHSTGAKGGIIPTLITTYPPIRNAYSERFLAQITLDELF